MGRDLAIVGALWVVLTVIGEVLAAVVDVYPLARADKGETIEEAFRILVFAAVPVFTLVVSVLAFSVLRWGTSQFPGEDGPPIRGKGPVPVAWLGITSGLALIVMVYPGLVGIPEVFDDPADPDLTVEVEGVQWAWLFEYPEHDVSTVNELVLPVDREVTFEITSTDVLHSFWIPAFLMKIDAVPGETTTMSLRPTEVGSYQTDSLLRVQCAELCGLAHSRMFAVVSVVTDEEFEEWLAGEAAAPAGEAPEEAAADAQRLEIAGKDSLFDLDVMTVEPEREVVVVFDNQDTGVSHNWALYESREAAESGAEPIAASPIEEGPVVQEIVFDPPPPGQYFFRCDVHPRTMIGEFTVGR